MKVRLRRMIGESKMVKSTKANNYFTDSMLFIPFYYEDRGDHKFGFETIPSRGYADSYQQGSGYTIYKKPAKTVDATVDELIEKLFELVPANVMQFFDLEYVLNYTFEFAKSEEEVEDDY